MLGLLLYSEPLQVGLYHHLHKLRKRHFQLPPELPPSFRVVLQMCCQPS